MGCFNTIELTCPGCGCITEAQSKAGSCQLNTYALEDAPLIEVADIAEQSKDGGLSCDHCHALLTIHIHSTIRVSVKQETPERKEKVGEL